MFRMKIKQEFWKRSCFENIRQISQNFIRFSKTRYKDPTFRVSPLLETIEEVREEGNEKNGGEDWKQHLELLLSKAQLIGWVTCIIRRIKFPVELVSDKEKLFAHK